MSEIICPYCCKRFQPTRMVFRLKKSLRAKPEGTQADEWMTGSALEEGIIDEQLKNYYMDIEDMDERTAELNATVEAEAIEINFAEMMMDISDYNEEFFEKNHYVLELTYKGQHLTQRLCPECHKELIPNAGLYDMKIIALYGDTYAGKTVYLNILEAALGGDPNLNTGSCAFQGSMVFQGNDMELREHENNYEDLLIDHKLPPATPGGQIVRPQVFWYSYKIADRTDKNLLLVFRDIPGEDTKSGEKMRRYAFYLKNADGILVLLDTSRLQQVYYYLQSDTSGARNGKVSQALGNLHDLLVAENGGEKISIPTAVVLAKADVLDEVQIPEVSGIYHSVIKVGGANTKEVSYLDRKEIRDLDEGVRSILHSLNEAAVILNPVENCFSEYRYFALSALGEDPREDGGEKRVHSIRPFRVTEPFFWILAMNNCIPYYHEEKWRNRKGKTKEISFYYYEKDRNGTVQRQLETMRKKKKILRRNLRGKLVRNPRWETEGPIEEI